MDEVGGPVEILYVDSASTDDSVRRAEAAGARVLQVRPQRPSAALGRNAGWRAARAPYVLFLDGDTLLAPAFPHKALARFADPQVAVVFGHRREIHPEASAYNRVLDLDWLSPAGPADYCGGDAILRRDMLEAVGGYDPGLIAGEEPEMCQRIRARGGVVLHIDEAMTGHDLAMTRWSQYWKRALRTGHAYAEVSGRLAGGPFPLWQEESRRNVRRGAVLLGSAVAGLVAALALPSLWPLLLVLAFFAALALRSAWRFRWKSRDPVTLLLYGIHSHVQQVPILLGQLGYWWDQRRGRRRQLIEYK
jgi:hypothetical protein